MKAKKKASAMSDNHVHGLNDLAWAPDSKCIATASDNKNVVVWDVEAQTPITKLTGHKNFVFCVNFSPCGSRIISGDYEGGIRIWDLRMASSLREIPRGNGHREPVTAVQFNPKEDTSALFVSGSLDGSYRIWDDKYMVSKTIYSEKNTKSPIGHVRFSPNGKYILVSSLDSTIRLSDYVAEKSPKHYRGHKLERVCSAATFSVTHGKNQYVVSGSEDGKVHLWHVSDKTIKVALEGHTEPVIAVDCHPTSCLIASGAFGPDKSIRIWEDRTAVVA
jgi:COMPASS component SWD3